MTKTKIKTNWKFVAGLLLILMLVCFYGEASEGILSKIMRVPFQYWWIPGLEGAKCKIHGLRFPDPPWEGWEEGANVYHTISGGTRRILYSDEGLGRWQEVYLERADYYTSNVWWDYHLPLGSGIDRQKLKIETEGMIQLENLNQHGDPLGWLGGDRATVVDAMQFQPNEFRDLEMQEVGSETHYSLSKLSILLVPATSHITFSFTPSKGNSQHDTNWQEGEWEAVEIWFELDFTTWYTVSEPYADDDYMPEWDAEYWRLNPASPYAYDKQVNWDSVSNPNSPNGKGGFPLCGWIQGYYENVGPDWDDEEWAIVNSGSEAQHYLLENQGPAELNALTSVSPELEGRYLGLYSNPMDPFEETASLTSYNAIESTARYYPWASAICPAYFSITIDMLGTWTEGTPIIGPWDIYYPAVNIEIRTIWAVYGYFEYLWTVETAEANDYPGWETRQYEQVHVPGPFDWLLDWFSNPLFWLFGFLILVIIILVILAVFAPGVLAVASATGKRVARKIEPDERRRPPPAPHWYVPMQSGPPSQ